ncbi:MAG TPA: transposase, partial [Candidatus Obscuribacterales bacterium]
RNAIEGKFGQGKRRFGLGCIRAKLATTAATVMALTMVVMNLERWLRHVLLWLLAWIWSVVRWLRRGLEGTRQVTVQSRDCGYLSVLLSAGQTR